MTPEDHQLDPEFFLRHQPLTLYRLARARYANLSGAGAAFAAGRWNRAGQEAIYTSTEKGVPLLERLVHTPKDLIPSNLAMMQIRVSGRWVMREERLADLQTGGLLFLYRDLATAKKSFQHDPRYFSNRPFAVAVPSVIVPVWNVVLFTEGMGFWELVSLESVEPFTFDPRLFPDEAMAEPS